MNQGPSNDNYVPLEEILEGLPEENPPQDMQQRCLQALDEADKARKPEPRSIWRRIPWNGLAAAAAVVLVVSVTSLLLPTYREKARQSSALSNVKQLELAPYAAEVPEAAEPMPALPPPAETESRAEAEIDVVTAMPAQPPAAPGRSQLAEEAPAYYRVRRPVTVTDSYGDQTAGANYAFVVKPWRDDSADRQKIAHKELELAVADVEEAYDRSASIIEKAGGYVDTEEIRIDEESKKKQAVISARVPVDRLDDVVDSLRELGEVVRLVGESEDRTKEYYGQGSNIRELGARECELVDKYLKEKNRSRKRELYRQIMALREQNKQRKHTLTGLSEQTHFAYLELTLVQKFGPRAFLNDTAERMVLIASWVGATAMFWAPIVLIAVVVWRRRAPATSE